MTAAEQAELQALRLAVAGKVGYEEYAELAHRYGKTLAQLHDAQDMIARQNIRIATQAQEIERLKLRATSNDDLASAAIDARQAKEWQRHREIAEEASRRGL
jgi:hypothetical protein